MQHECVVPPCIGSFVRLLLGGVVVVANDSSCGLSPAEGCFGGSLCSRFASLHGTCSGGRDQGALAGLVYCPEAMVSAPVEHDFTHRLRMRLAILW
jgi:hypothetical protein